MVFNIIDTPNGCSISVKVIPNSSKTRINGLLGHTLKINLAVAPEKGKANKELTKHLAKILGLPKSALSISAGIHDRNKVIQIANLNKKELELMLNKFIKSKK